MDSEDNKVYMKRLNPHSVDKKKEWACSHQATNSMTLSKGKISNSFCQSTEQQKMGKTQ